MTENFIVHRIPSKLGNTDLKYSDVYKFFIHLKQKVKRVDLSIKISSTLASRELYQ